MIKKLIVSTLLATSFMYANSSNNIKYLEEEKMENNNIRPFIGMELGFALLSSNEPIDKTIYSSGFYAGIPIYTWELISKYKISNTKDFNLNKTSLSLNIPISGSGTDMTYIGVIAGQSDLSWSDNRIASFSLIKQDSKNSFYGIHIGQKYKYSRNYYLRVELEYSKYEFETKSYVSDVLIDYSTEFICAFEYKF
ncbi:MAG TPA: hypothetical protein EYG73_05185 [Arcobacter sp.]|nr:hypothetical protein [Arcobacter sp.]